MSQPEFTETLRSQPVVNSQCGFSQSQILVAASSLYSRIKVGARSDLMKVYIWGAHDLPQQTTTTSSQKLSGFFSASFDPFSSRGTAGRSSRAPKTLLIAVVSLKWLVEGPFPWRGASRFGAGDCCVFPVSYPRSPFHRKHNRRRSLNTLYFLV